MSYSSRIDIPAHWVSYGVKWFLFRLSIYVAVAVISAGLFFVGVAVYVYVSPAAIQGMIDDFDIHSVIVKYMVGVLGSIAVEAAALLRAVSANDGKLPKTYYTWTYLFVRAFFTFVATGPLAVLLTEKSAWTAFYIGISAPFIYDRAAAGLSANGLDFIAPDIRAPIVEPPRQAPLQPPVAEPDRSAPGPVGQLK